MNSNFPLENRYSALEDQLKEAGQSTTAKAVHQDQARNEKKKGKSKSKSKQSTNESNKNLSYDQIQLQQEEQQEPKTKTSVVVAGDSRYNVLRYVKGWEISTGRQNLSVKSFSGATVDDMSDFLIPTVRKHPDKLIIQAGTNDIRKSDPKTVADKLTDLAKQFKKDSGNTEVVMSSLVVRTDGPELAKNVKQTNIVLKSNCISNNLTFLDNSNINRSHLNYRGLHLNREIFLLQNNITNIFKSKD